MTSVGCPGALQAHIALCSAASTWFTCCTWSPCGGGHSALFAPLFAHPVLAHPPGCEQLRGMTGRRGPGNWRRPALLLLPAMWVACSIFLRPDVPPGSWPDLWSYCFFSAFTPPGQQLPPPVLRTARSSTSVLAFAGRSCQRLAGCSDRLSHGLGHLMLAPPRSWAPQAFLPCAFR